MVEQFKLESKQNSKGKKKKQHVIIQQKKQIWEPQSFANIVSASKISDLQLVHHPVTNSKKLQFLDLKQITDFHYKQKKIHF